MSVYDVLEERGFIQQTTHDKPLKDLLENEKVTFYIGFDPTADSLHVGSFLQIMAMAHMQKAGHRPIALVGGGTGMVGDPTGKTDMRKMLTKEEIDHNANSIKKQLSKFIDFGDGKALLVNNADWLMSLNYIDFLREVGVHFSVNKMLTAECFKTRMAKGLSFLEFNYMLMQGYDFYMLNRKYGCKLEMGGDDQWSNILAGVDLVRRKASDDAYGMTFTLLTNSEGKKMGKTVSGAVWLDADKTSPYDFYQYWRNIDDRDVEKCLALLTYVPMEEVRRLGSYKDERINDSKVVLAYELTKIVHGKDEADKAREAAESIFSKGKSSDSMPTTTITPDILENNKRVVELLQLTGITSSNGEGRRLIQGGGISVNDKKITDVDMELTVNDFGNGDIIIKKGKKVYHKVVLQK